MLHAFSAFLFGVSTLMQAAIVIIPPHPSGRGRTREIMHLGLLGLLASSNAFLAITHYTGGGTT